jgi:small multidrug resistance family-3 protein
VTTNVALFVLAAVFEIAGCFAFWVWVRRGAAPWVVVLGIASLVGFALALTRVDSAFAGRTYAAYGGIYIAASLAWLWVVERQTPTRADVLGTAFNDGRLLLCAGPTRVRGQPHRLSSSRINAFISSISLRWLSMIWSANFLTRGSEISARSLVRMAIE